MAWKNETSAEFQFESQDFRNYFKNFDLENRVKYVTI